jgi:hypothetical protein
MQRGLVFAALLMISLLGAALSAKAGEYKSGFGFGITVPDVWLVLTRGEVADSADLFLAADGSTGLGSVPLTMRRVVYDRVQAGELEIFYRRDEVPGTFIDNVNILVQPADLPSAPRQLARICEILPAQFSRVFGRPIAMDVCELRERVNHRSLYLQFDGAVMGTTTLQYQIQRGPNATLILTATAATENLPRMLGEFEEMIGSIRLY